MTGFSKVVELIDSKYCVLSKNDRLIADFVISNLSVVADSTVVELASLIKTNESAIFRFSKKLGFKGYPDFKMFVARDVVTLEELVTNDEETNHVCKRKNRITMQLEKTYNVLEMASLNSAVNFLTNADNIYVLGYGSSALTAQFCDDRFMRFGVNSKLLLNPIAQKMTASVSTKKDVFIAISISGFTKDTVDTAKIAKERGATVIAITSYTSSPLAEISDVILKTVTKENIIANGSLYNNISQLFVVEVLTSTFIRLNDKRLSENLKILQNDKFYPSYDMRQVEKDNDW